MSARNSYSRILVYLKNYRAQFAIALICMVTFGATDGIIPFLIKNVLDGVFTKHDQHMLLIIPVLLIGFALVRAVADFGQQFLISKVGHYIVRDIRNQINEHLLTLSPEYFVRNSSADLLSRVTSDVLLVRTLLTDSFAAVLRDVVRVVALLIAAIYLDPFLALLAFVVFPIGVYPVYRFGRHMRKLSKKGQDAIGSLTSMLQESMIGNRVVKIFGREKFETTRFMAENDELTATFLKSEKVRALTGPVNEVLATCAIAGIIVYGGYTVIGGIRSQGDFIAFLISVFLLYDPFKKLSRVHNVVQQGIAGADRIFEVLDTEATIKDPPSPLPLTPKNDIQFLGVSFRYAVNDQDALTDVTLSITESQKVAFVGFSGAGKSTLIDLVPRFIDPTHGVVKIGGVDISKVKLSELRERISLVGQHTFLFNDTVYNNIAYGRECASKEEVYEAAKAAYAYDFIMMLPKGFDTVIGESGLSLSGGERQRIAIARAILKNSPILILDEATASLDNRSEREVQSAIEALEKNRTTLVIAHRLSTIRNADLIVVLKNGFVVEIGRHDELLKKEGEYSKLYALQFSAADDKDNPDEVVIN